MGDVYLSVVAPAYNEAENLPTLVEEISAQAASLNQPYEIIIVNDASEDESLKILLKLQKNVPQLRFLTLKSRSGQTAALDAGLRNARGQFLATLDADLQNDPADIPKLLAVVADGQCDMATGWRQKRQDNPLRLISTKVANGVRNWLTRESIVDSASGLKVFRRECIQRIKLFNGMHRFLPTLVKMEGYRVKEVPVNHRPRMAGTAKYGVWNRVFKALRDTFAVRWMQSRIVLYELEE